MKKGYIFLLAAFAWMGAQAEDNNTFYFTDAVVMVGETANIELCMRNTATDLTCLEAEIQLPEGLSVVSDVEGNPVCTLYRNRTKEHEILANVLADGNLKLLISSINGKLIGGGEGPLLSFCVQVAETAPRGEFTLETVGESLLVNTVAEAYYSIGVKGNVLITDDPTIIVSPLGETEEGAAIYNLAGQRLSKKQKGIFIKDGKNMIGK